MRKNIYKNIEQEYNGLKNNKNNANQLIRTENKCSQNMQMPIKAIIFDIGGVIIHYPAEKYFDYLSKKHNISINKIQSFVNPLRKELELGNISTRNFLKQISNEFKIPPNKLDWQKSFKIFLRTDQNMVNLINNLWENYNIYIISNITRTGFIMCNKELEKSNCRIDRKFASCYIHSRKPDPEIYLHALRKTKSHANETIFIDDKKNNIDAAIKLGMNGILFSNLNQLIQDLKKLNIKINISL